MEAKKHWRGYLAPLDVAVQSHFRPGVLNHATALVSSATEPDDSENRFALEKPVRSTLCAPISSWVPPLDWPLTLLAFDTYV